MEHPCELHLLTPECVARHLKTEGFVPDLRAAYIHGVQTTHTAPQANFISRVIEIMGEQREG